MSVHKVLMLGPIRLNLLGLMIGIGVLTAVYYCRRHADRAGLKKDIITDLLFSSVLVGMLGARALYVLMELPSYISNPYSILRVWEGGLSFFGGLSAGAVYAWFAARRSHINPLVLADLASPAVALAYAIGRLGCDIYGRPTALPWAVSVYGVPRHPVWFYSAVAGLAMFLLLHLWSAQRLFAGRQFLTFLALYGAYRFIIEFFRESVMFGPVSYSQIVSLLMVLAPVLLIKWFDRQQTKNVTPQQ
ncbi:MAG: prolipoprotein diacylglyceryl transferase [Bacillota bacterium]